MRIETLYKARSEYLAMRRALGYKLLRPGKSLASFVRFAEAEGASVITTDLALRWAKLPQNVDPSTWSTRLALIRRFARYCQSRMPGTEVPPEGLLCHRYHRKQPYIFADHEISSLLDASRQLSSRCGLRPFTYETLLGLLTCTGTRIGEVLALNDSDVDLDNNVLTIHGSKFGKTRYVPFHETVGHALHGYRDQRDRCVPRRQSMALLVTERGSRLSYSGVKWTFKRLLRITGLDSCRVGRRPRLHDIRHTFSVRTLLGWYRRGTNVEARLPHLSTYLGHTHVADTYWYISNVPELLLCALRRLEKAQLRRKS